MPSQCTTAIPTVAAWESQLKQESWYAGLLFHGSLRLKRLPSVRGRCWSSRPVARIDSGHGRATAHPYHAAIIAAFPMAAPSKSSGSTGALARRLRVLADRLGQSPPLAGGLLRRIEAGLAEWEHDLGADAAPPAEPHPPAGDAPRPAAPPPRDSGVIRIWCDGSSAPNPGAGGWGAIVERDGAREELSGGARDSTNNIMEMTAAMEALRRTPEGAAVHITTDSQYLKNGITKWIHNWKRKGWRKADGAPVLNQQLWRELDALASARRVEWAWTRGHSGHPENERCDELAGQARLEHSP